MVLLQIGFASSERNAHLFFSNVLILNACLIQIDFHDTSTGPRVPPMTDHYGFTMASLNENGSVFANPCKGEKNMSTLMYRPFSSWANNSEVRAVTFSKQSAFMLGYHVFV